ncbi:MAG TPA: hypothetical protein VK964_07785 [Nocardioidaceae bacterium]|nr:hypothetical protein [Nocardioidaceae bacterium]
MTRPMRVAVRVWPWVLAVVVLAPVLAPGYVLSYDMVFVPDLALRSDFLGLGSSLPRAVPSDAVVAVVDEVVPGMVLQKLVLVAALVLAGIGARRLVPVENGVAQLAATSLYVWNPYVAERLGIGHWPLLLAYAALPWIFDAARRARAGEQGALAVLVLWLGLAALSAAGGLMAAAVALVFVWGRDRGALRRTLLVGGAALAVNAPWLVAGLLHGSGALTDPTAVEAFAARGEGVLPVPLTVLGLGGIWNAEVVPLSRQGWVAVFALAAVVAVCAAGLRRWLRWLPRRDSWGLAALAAVGLLVGSAGAITPGLMEWFVASVPGGGLLRDGSRYLALVAPLQAGLFGAGAGVLAGVMREQVGNVALAAGAVLLPIAVMPDLAWGLAGSLRPVDFPQEYAEAREVMVESMAERDEGALLVLPFSSYRAPSWNHGRRTLDPVGRYMPANYVASDVLYVSGRPIEGEDRRARRVQDMLSDAEDRMDLARALGGEGIAWVLVDLEAERVLGEGVPSLDTASLPQLHAGDLLVVAELGERVDQNRRDGVVWVAVAWALAGVTSITSLAVALRKRPPKVR